MSNTTKDMINKIHGAFVCERLKAARKAAGGTLPWNEVAAIIQHAYEDEVRAFTASYQPPPVKPVVVARKRNEFIDALAESCGGVPAQMTTTAIRSVAVAFAEIKQVSPEVTVEEIRRRVERYKEKHRDWPLTATAVSKHWHDLGPAFGRTYSAANDPYIEADNWRARAKQVYPDADFEGKEWKDIGLLIRKDILSKS